MNQSRIGLCKYTEDYSIGPRSFSTCSITFFVFSRSATSQLYATALTPAFSQASFASLWASTVRSSKAILAPVLARLSAIAAPMPGSIQLVSPQDSERGHLASSCTSHDSDFAYIGIHQSFYTERWIWFMLQSKRGDAELCEIHS